MRTILASVLLLTTLAACDSPGTWYNGPGWYLSKPHMIISGRDWYGGPMSYDDCEAKRKAEEVAYKMLCSWETKAPE